MCEAGYVCSLHTLRLACAGLARGAPEATGVDANRDGNEQQQAHEAKDSAQSGSVCNTHLVGVSCGQLASWHGCLQLWSLPLQAHVVVMASGTMSLCFFTHHLQERNAGCVVLFDVTLEESKASGRALQGQILFTPGA